MIKQSFVCWGLLSIFMRHVRENVHGKMCQTLKKMGLLENSKLGIFWFAENSPSRIFPGMTRLLDFQTCIRDDRKLNK